MFAYQHTIETDATPQAVWKLYSDVSTWPRWDDGAEYVQLDGPFTAGAKGIAKFIGQEPLAFVLIEVVPNERFTDQTIVPDAGISVRATHTLVPLANGRTQITHAFAIDGPAAETLGPMITADVPHTMKNLVRLALGQM
jgi:hypothetical protein